MRLDYNDLEKYGEFKRDLFMNAIVFFNGEQVMRLVLMADTKRSEMRTVAVDRYGVPITMGDLWDDAEQRGHSFEFPKETGYYDFVELEHRGDVHIRHRETGKTWG